MASSMIPRAWKATARQLSLISSITAGRWRARSKVRLSSFAFHLSLLAVSLLIPNSGPSHERALSPADLFGGKVPVGALIGLLERIC